MILIELELNRLNKLDNIEELEAFRHRFVHEKKQYQKRRDELNFNNCDIIIRKTKEKIKDLQGEESKQAYLDRGKHLNKMNLKRANNNL